MRSAHVSTKFVLGDLGVHHLNVSPGRLDAALASLRRSQSVLYAEHDAYGQIMDTIPNDYWWPSEWSQTKVSAPKTWDLTRGSANVTVAVLDTGVDASQPDLQGAFVPGWNTLGNNSDTSDSDGHGTLVAGVALARNNTIGITSYCWTCSVMPVKVIDTNSGTVSPPALLGQRTTARESSA
jgi:subtilisin family serine protease